MKPFPGTTAFSLLAAALATTLSTQAQDFPQDAPNPRVVLTSVPNTAFGNMGMDFLSDGRMVLLSNGTVALGAESDLGGGDIQQPNQNRDFAVYLIDGLSANGSLAGVTATKILDQLTGPPPGVVVVNDTVYVMDRTAFYRINSLSPTGGISKAQNATRLIDVPGLDSNFSWNRGPSGHQWMFTPQYHEGRFYAAYAGSIRRPATSGAPPTNTLTGSILSWARDTVVPPNVATASPDNNKGFIKEAGGIRSPNGMATNGLYMLHTDNQGSFTPGNPVRLFKPGQPLITYGHRQGTPDNRGGASLADISPTSNANNVNTLRNWAEDLPYQPPVIHIPFSPFRSITQPVYVDFGPYDGHWLLGDVNGHGVGRLWIDNVDSTGNYQASFTLFSGGELNRFEITGSGLRANRAINRMTRSPDSAIYIGSIYRRNGNWSAGETAPVLRLTFKDTSLFEITAVRSRKSSNGQQNGVEIFFSEPIDPATLQANTFSLTQYNYMLGAAYGCGTSCSQRTPTVSDMEVSSDGRRVFLSIAMPDTSIGPAHIGTLGVGDNGVGVWGGPGNQDRTLRVTVNNALRSAAGASLYYNIAWMGWFYQSEQSFLPTAATELPIERPPVSIANPVARLASSIDVRAMPGALTVNIGKTGPATVSLYSLNGALKHQVSGNTGSFQIDTRSLGQGIHVLRVRHDGTAYSRRLML